MNRADRLDEASLRGMEAYGPASAGAGGRSPVRTFLGRPLGGPFDGAEEREAAYRLAWNGVKADPGSAALLAGLSMLAANRPQNGRTPGFGELLGAGGLGAISGMEEMQDARARAQNARLELVRKQAELAGMGLSEPGSGVPERESGGSLPARQSRPAEVVPVMAGGNSVRPEVAGREVAGREGPDGEALKAASRPLVPGLRAFRRRMVRRVGG